MRISGGKRSTGRKPAPVPLLPPQIVRDLGSNPDQYRKTATSCLNYGTVSSICDADPETE
jgi:hypothetical protein